MILLRPVKRIGNQEVGHLRTSVVVNQSTPVRMRALAGIPVLINTGSVKAGQSIGIPREMSRNPVQNHADSLTVHIIHKVHKIIRRSVTAGRCIVAGYLISPGSVQRMLHHRHQFYMGIAHALNIFSQTRRNLPVVIKFRAHNVIALFVLLRMLADPGTKMHLINRHGLFLRINLFPGCHPGIITPGKLIHIPHNRSCVRTHFRIISIRIRL